MRLQIWLGTFASLLHKRKEGYRCNLFIFVPALRLLRRLPFLSRYQWRYWHVTQGLEVLRTWSRGCYPFGICLPLFEHHYFSRPDVSYSGNHILHALACDLVSARVYSMFQQTCASCLLIENCLVSLQRKHLLTHQIRDQQSHASKLAFHSQCFWIKCLLLGIASMKYRKGHCTK